MELVTLLMKILGRRGPKDLLTIFDRYISDTKPGKPFTWCSQLRQNLILMKATLNSIHRTENV
jgi:hypothetical protein